MDRLERLLNLVIALRETRLPLTAEDIRTRVAGYGQEERESFRRMFERDKADLRELGVPITQARVSRWDDRQGYRIDAHAYELPPLAFAPDELTALAFAVELTGLGEEAGSGLLKLAVDADVPDAATTAATPPVRLEVDAPHRRDLMAAIHARSTVTFTYRPRGARPARRRVDPHALVHVRGRWYLLGSDHDRAADRTYRLDRITSPVRVASAPAAFPPRGGAVTPEEVLGDRGAAEEPARVAHLRASSEVAWQVARRATGPGSPDSDGVRFDVRVADVEQLVTWVLSFGAEVEVVGPPALRQAVIDRLQQAVAAHAS